MVNSSAYVHIDIENYRRISWMRWRHFEFGSSICICRHHLVEVHSFAGISQEHSDALLIALLQLNSLTTLKVLVFVESVDRTRPNKRNLEVFK
jgi:hypothetical protein